MKHLKAVLDFATEKHKGQKRKDGKDYITHPIEVARIAIEMAREDNEFNEKYIEMIYVISILHDILEDTDTVNIELEELLQNTKEFTGAEISQMINSVFNLTRISKFGNIVNYLKEIKHNHLARIVKLADLEHNISDLAPGNLRDKYNLCRYFLEN